MTCNEMPNAEQAGTDAKTNHNYGIYSSSTPCTPLSDDFPGFRAEDSRTDDTASDDTQMCHLYEKRLSWADMCEDMSDDEPVRTPVYTTAASPRTQEAGPKISSRSSRVNGWKYSTGNVPAYSSREPKGDMLAKPFYKKLESVQMESSSKFRRKPSQPAGLIKTVHEEVNAAVSAFDFAPVVRSQLEQSTKEHLTSVNERVLDLVKQQASAREAELELTVCKLSEEAASTRLVVEGLRQEVSSLQTEVLAASRNDKDTLMSERIESLAAELTKLRAEMCDRDAVFAEALKTIKAAQTAQAAPAAPTAPDQAANPPLACASAGAKASPRSEPRRRHSSRLAPGQYASSPSTPTTPRSGDVATTQPGGPFPLNCVPLSNGNRRLSRGTNKPPTAPPSPRSSTPLPEPPQTPTRATHPSPAPSAPHPRARRGRTSATSAAHAIEGLVKVIAASQSPGLAQQAQKIKTTADSQPPQPADAESNTNTHQVAPDLSLGQNHSVMAGPPSSKAGPATNAKNADVLVDSGLSTEC